MKERARTATFILFATSFFACAGLVVFHTLGYRYNFERGIFIYTGSITVQANPADVSIVLDKDPSAATIKQLNSAYHISSISPGEHTLDITADGYRPWSKKVLVSSGVSTEFWNVMLTKNSYPETLYDAKRLIKVFPSPKSTLLAFVSSHEEGSGFTVSALDTETNTSTQLFTTQDYTFDPLDKENIEWSIDADFVSIPTIKDGIKNHFIVDIANKTSVNLSDIAGAENLRSVRWDSSRNTFLLALSEDGTLYEFDTAASENTRTLATHVQGYDISGNDLYVLESSPSNIVYKTSLSTTDSPRIQITTLPTQQATDDHYSVIAYDENRIALINYSTETLYLFNKTSPNDSRLIGPIDSAKGAQFSDDGKKVLFWTHNEMSVLFTRKWETQPIREENSLSTIGRFAQPIDNVHWAKDYEHVTFSVDATIKLIELDTRGERSLSDITTLSSQPIQILSNFAENMLFFVTENAQTNERILRSIAFPEKVSGLFTRR